MPFKGDYMGSLIFNNVYLHDYFTIGGPKEKESKLKKLNFYLNDYYYQEKTFELAEIKMQKSEAKSKQFKITYYIVFYS